MPDGVQSGKPEAVGEEAGEQKLLSRSGKYGAGEAVAEGESRLPAQKET